MKLYDKYMTKIEVLEDNVSAQDESIKKWKEHIEDSKNVLRRSREVLGELKSEKLETEKRIIELRNDMNKAMNASYRRQIQKLCDKYDLSVERETRDSYYDHSTKRPVTEYQYWVDCPEWLEKDPISDGHCAIDLGDVLNILEVYAKHHPDHPEHDKREYDPVLTHM